MDRFKEVSKNEYDAFIKEYPNQLDWNVANMYEPPLGTYNDFSNGKIWPDSIVAMANFYDGSEFYEGKETTYEIIDKEKLIFNNRGIENG